MAISTIGANSLAQSRILTTVQQPVGTVLQVVQGTYATQVFNGTNTFADSGLTASITPTSSSSKIFILVSTILYSQRAAADTGSKLQLVRGSTNILTQGNSTFYIATSGSVAEIISNIFVQYFDAPATTSSTTYKLQFASNPSCNSYINWNNQASYMTLMEIAV